MPGGAGGTAVDAEWPTGGETLDADPSSIRGFAENAGSIAGNLQDDLMTNVTSNLNGLDTGNFSGSFPPGLEAQRLAGTRASQMSAGLNDCHTNLLAISMASHTCADLLRGGDDMAALGANAVNYAFNADGASPPSGLPSYMDGTTLHGDQDSAQEVTGGSEQGENELISTSTERTERGAATVSVYQTPSGGTLVVVAHGDGTYEERSSDQNGSSHSVVPINGGATTRYWDAEGNLTRTERKHEASSGNPGLGYTEKNTFTETYDGDDKLTERTTTKTERTYDDGTREIGTTNEDGEFEVQHQLTAHPDDASPNRTTLPELPDDVGQSLGN